MVARSSLAGSLAGSLWPPLGQWAFRSYPGTMSVAKITAYPDRSFKSRYWSLAGERHVWICVSDEEQPHMLAVDLQDADPNLKPVITRTRAGELPFRNAREERAGQIGRFLVAELGA